MNSFLASVALLLVVLSGCAPPQDEASDPDAVDGDGHGHTVTEPRDEITPRPGLALDPQAGFEIGWMYEAYLSPQQEADEETDVPDLAPDAFRSTAPSTPREERAGRGHGVVAFSRDMSRAYVHLALSGIDPDEIVMAHLHCGKPGQLGPIIVDFGTTGDVSEYFADGRLDYEIVNADLERVIDSGEGIVGAFTAGCPIIPARPDDRVRTIAGMAAVAREGDLYFNVHTAGQTFYGDIRGQLYPADPETLRSMDSEAAAL